jgi:hypothetical protein
VRDWFRLVLWYVRVRRASRTGQIHSNLLEIESRISIPANISQDPKRALLSKPNPRLLDVSPRETDNAGSEDSDESEKLEDILTQKVKEAMSRSSRAKREFFSGCKF